MSNRVATACVVLAASVALAALYRPSAEGCPAYIPHDGPLIAHAGGGLPDRLYANNLEALNLAVKHGHTLIELDFIEKDGALLIGHDESRMSDLTVPQLMSWLERNPSVSIVTDIKTDNLSGLSKLSNRERFIPQIYSPDEYAAVSKMGFQEPILTVYRLRDGWQEAAKSLPLRAVTVPYERRSEASGIHRPLFVHFVDVPERKVAGFGLYTRCFVPA